MPPQVNFRAIEAKNQTNLKALQNKGSIDYMFTMLGSQPLLLIGPGHDAAVTQAVRDAQHHHGTITIKKGEALSGPGELTVTGMANRRAEFQSAIARFSKKKVVYR
jgi:hypothetical protein